eukprot:Anaeramoba_ignava/a638257_26.p1 GENE.a638257_26~~a638257_26.p1  ORF type:complete len:200 (-),score=61.89 a638257_26:1-600(-)
MQKLILLQSELARKEPGQTKMWWRLCCFAKIYGTNLIFIKKNKETLPFPSERGSKNFFLQSDEKLVIGSKFFRIQNIISHQKIDCIRRAFRTWAVRNDLALLKPYRRGKMVFISNTQSNFEKSPFDQNNNSESNYQELSDSIIPQSFQEKNSDELNFELKQKQSPKKTKKNIDEDFPIEQETKKTKTQSNSDSSEGSDN